MCFKSDKNTEQFAWRPFYTNDALILDTTSTAVARQQLRERPTLRKSLLSVLQ